MKQLRKTKIVGTIGPASENKLEELMPLECSIHPFSVRTYLKYIKYYENIDFARYSNENYDYEKINNIKIPLFIRWGNNKELIKQNAEDLVCILKNKLSNTNRKAKNIKNTYMYDKLIKPGALIECGFLSNQKEKNKLTSDTYQQELAKTIADSIIKYYLKK